MRKRVSLISLLLLLTTLATYSQEKKMNEWLVWGNYGSSSLLYRVYGGSLTAGMGSGIGAGCVIPVFPQWRLLVGLELQGYASTVHFDQLIDSHQSTAKSVVSTNEEVDNSAKNRFLYTATFDHFREQQEVAYLQVPVMARFEIGKLPLYAMAGVKLGIPVKSTFHTSASMLTTTGYFAYDNLTITQQPEYGFGKQSSYEAEGKLALDWQLSVSSEFGYQMGITSRTSLYLAIYLDYAVTDGYKEASAQDVLIAYNASNPTKPTQYSLLATQQNHISLSGYTYNRIQSISGGVKIAFGFTTPQFKGKNPTRLRQKQR